MSAPIPFPKAPPFDPALPAAERSQTILASLPGPLSAILASGTTERRSRFVEDGFDGLVESWTAPATVTARDAAAARRALDDLERTVLAPAEPGHVLGRVLALLSHFPAKAASSEVEQMIALDWAEDLGEFPSWAIDRAARIWRRSRKWRPSIAEMRALCEAACAGERALARRLRAIVEAGERRPAEPARGGAPDRPAAVRALAGRAVRRMA